MKPPFVRPFPGKGAVGLRARGRTRQRKEGMNKTEAKYAAHLDLQLSLGQIKRWDYEPESLILAKLTRYTPDFRVVTADDYVEFHEVKGHWEDDARVKIKLAAELHPYRFVAVRWEGGAWHLETIDP